MCKIINGKLANSDEMSKMSYPILIYHSLHYEEIVKHDRYGFMS